MRSILFYDDTLDGACANLIERANKVRVRTNLSSTIDMYMQYAYAAYIGMLRLLRADTRLHIAIIAVAYARTSSTDHNKKNVWIENLIAVDTLAMFVCRCNFSHSIAVLQLP